MRYRTAIECPFCGNTTGPWATAIQPMVRDGEIALFERDETIYMVCQCGGYFQNPMPTDESIDKLYRDKYYDVFQARKQALAFEMPRALRMTEHLPQEPGSMIDVGCATGELMSLAKEAGWQVTGVEPGKRGRARAKPYGTVYRNCDEVDETFDLVMSVHVLEHVARPVDFLKQLAKLLAPGGLMIVVVPKNNYRPSHLTGINEETVKILFDRAGIGNVEIGSFVPYADLTDIIVKVRI